MKKILTTALLAFGAATAANAQVQYDLVVDAFTFPTENQKFLCTDDIWIETTWKNNGPDNLDLTTDTTLLWGYLNSTDSQGGGLQFFSGYDSIKIDKDATLSFKSRTRKVSELFRVFDQDGANPEIFREDPRHGIFVLYADHTGIGRVDPSNNMFQEASNFEETDSNNNLKGVRVELCTELNSIRSINANTSAVNVYPNPTSNGVVNFAYRFSANEEATIRVMDVTGRTVLTETVKGAAGSQNITLNVANLQAGMYNLEIATATGRGVSKFTVAK